MSIQTSKVIIKLGCIAFHMTGYPLKAGRVHFLPHWRGAGDPVICHFQKGDGQVGAGRLQLPSLLCCLLCRDGVADLRPRPSRINSLYFLSVWQRCCVVNTTAHRTSGPNESQKINRYSYRIHHLNALFRLTDSTHLECWSCRKSRP